MTRPFPEVADLAIVYYDNPVASVFCLYEKISLRFLQHK
jgi:hypothetical protein